MSIAAILEHNLLLICSLKIKKLNKKKTCTFKIFPLCGFLTLKLELHQSP